MLDRSGNGVIGWMVVSVCGLVAGPLLAQPHGIAFGNAARFFPSAEVAASEPPSFAFESVPRSTKAIPGDFEYVPEYSVEEGRTTAKLKLPEGASLYGLGASPGGLLRNGATLDGPPPLPWVLAVGADGNSIGVFPDTTFACQLSLDGAIRINSADPKLPVVVLKGATPIEVMQGFNELTGRLEMPPRWALGYHQARANGEAGVRSAAKWLRDAGIPADSVWMDGQDGAVGWQALHISDAEKLVSDLRDSGLRIVSGVPAGIRRREGEATFDSGTAAEAWMQLDSGAPAAMPGGFVMPDYTREGARTWWSGLIDTWAKSGAAGFTVPRRDSFTLPAGVDLRADRGLGGPAGGDQYQLVLPTLFARATTAGAGGEKADRRPFVTAATPALTLQRSAAIVLPAEGASWESLQSLIPTILNSTMSGHPLVGVEIPDFRDSDPELARRWSGLAATLPLSVGSFAASPENPMLTAEFKQAHAAALQRRYRLIPYYYTLCFDAFFSCQPILLPLFFADLADMSLRTRQDAFLIGMDLLVVPRLKPGTESLPCPLKGKWKKVDLGVGETPDLPELYLRPGAILPVGPILRDTAEKPTDPITLVINLDPNGNAMGFVYEDDGDGYAFYRNKCRRVGYSATREGDSILVRLSKLDGGEPLPKRKLEIRLLTDSGEIVSTGSEKGTVKINLPAAAPTPEP